jgi:MFS family permease
LSNPSAESLGEHQPGGPAALWGEAAMVVPLLQAAIFMVSAEARLLTPLLPVLARSFESSVVEAGLVVTAYSIPYGVFQLVYGPLADRFGRQLLIALSLSIFALGTLLTLSYLALVAASGSCWPAVSLRAGATRRRWRLPRWRWCSLASAPSRCSGAAGSPPARAGASRAIHFAFCQERRE